MWRPDELIKIHRLVFFDAYRLSVVDERVIVSVTGGVDDGVDILNNTAIVEMCGSGAEALRNISSRWKIR